VNAASCSAVPSGVDEVLADRVPTFEWLGPADEVTIVVRIATLAPAAFEVRVSARRGLREES
jgi:hypothetical protein